MPHVPGAARLLWEPLSPARFQELRQLWSSVRYLTVDEISMVSAATLWHIHRRLVEIKGAPEDWPFGGVNMVVLGDFYQVTHANLQLLTAAVVNLYSNTVHVWLGFCFGVLQG